MGPPKFTNSAASRQVFGPIISSGDLPAVSTESTVPTKALGFRVLLFLFALILANGVVPAPPATAQDDGGQMEAKTGYLIEVPVP